MQGFSFVQSPYIMEARIKQSSPPTECLQTTTHLSFMLQDGYFHSVLGQNVTAFQPAQTSSNDNDTLSLHHFRKRFEKKLKRIK